MTQVSMYITKMRTNAKNSELTSLSSSFDATILCELRVYSAFSNIRDDSDSDSDTFMLLFIRADYVFFPNFRILVKRDPIVTIFCLSFLLNPAYRSLTLEIETFSDFCFSSLFFVNLTLMQVDFNSVANSAFEIDRDALGCTVRGRVADECEGGV